MNIKTKRIILIFTGFFFFTNLNAQDTTNFFPHQVGDHWEYRFAEDWSIEKILTIEKDSTDSAGNTFIKYQQEPYFSVRIDSVNNVYEWDGLFQEDYGLWYKFPGQVGDRWVVRNDTFFNKITWAHIVDIFPGVVFFNIPATVMQIDYWWETVDDDSFWVETRYLADGYGFVERMFEPGGVTVAAGAIINGVSYGILTGLEDRDVIPEEITLAQNYPNPFNPVTTIRYDIPVNTHASLKVFNLLGQEVAVLTDRRHLPGSYEVTFDASHLSSDFYVYVLQTAEVKRSGRMLFVQ